MNLNQVTIPVLDVKKSIGFYQNLGLELIVESLPAYARFICPEGNATLSLHKVEKLPSGEGIWIYFETRDLNQLVSEFQLKGFVFEELPEDKPWLWKEARLKDLDNNQIIIYHAGKNRINPPWRIK
jgi:catechol 2,3-dioxygenase-like lactoylglutathione lyase family enzyme